MSSYQIKYFWHRQDNFANEVGAFRLATKNVLLGSYGAVTQRYMTYI
jgi:hypothetical protein